VKGFAYDVEVTRVLNRERKIDRIFGIDIPIIAHRNKAIDLIERLNAIRNKTFGSDGVLLHRCFNDLTSAMKNPDDTGFYCYRAIEALRQHCVRKFKLNPDKDNRSEQWKKFREFARCDEQTLRDIKSAADPVRHGDVIPITSAERADLFKKTWDVVDAYLESI
jgi:hypothetical protein